MISYWELLVSAVIGGFGYLMVEFWMRPILRYRDLKHQIIVDLIYYANAVNPEGMGQLIQQQNIERRLRLRKHSAEITACFYQLPEFYQDWLSQSGEEPMNAAPRLMRLSNTSDYEKTTADIEAIKKLLRIEAPI